MNSITLYTEEIDDLNEAALELFSQAEEFVFQKNSMGILYTEEDTDYSELYGLLSEKWDFPIVGCTATAMLLGKEGYCGLGISIMLLTADDCEFAAGITEDLNQNNLYKEIGEVYGELRKKLSEEPKLVLTFGGMSRDDVRNVSGDDLVDAIDKATGGIPIYGVLASDGFTFDKFRIFHNEKESMEAEILVLISGNIEPKMICINSVENRANFYYEVTESHSNQVDRLGNSTFVEALAGENLKIDQDDIQGAYLLSPFVYTQEKENGDKIEVARTLMSLNREKGAGNFIGAIPQGSYLSIGIISRADVQKSVQMAFDIVFKELEQKGNKYHTLLCNSCSARFLALANNTAAEAKTYIGRLPEDVSLMGIYANGELCPVKGDKTGKYYNVFHNFTFTILAI
ncbi:MAG: FIST C-terminal domain-containing protein [Lachnospiraceae bacterium]|nr:FIST C-terminal domain-containing protein [Lachnospiraceae bacterium]